MNHVERTLLPQAAVNGKSIRDSANWLFEPYWNGERLLAFIDGPDVTLVDYMGDRVDRAFPQVADSLRSTVTAGQAVVDVVLVDSWFPSVPPEDRTPVIVALDLLALDGDEILDVPLLERRRLLEAIVDETNAVRVTPAVRAPIESSMNAWRAQGFRACLAKHANSRYLPGERNAEWVRISIEHIRPGGVTGLLIGTREREPQIKP